MQVVQISSVLLRQIRVNMGVPQQQKMKSANGIKRIANLVFVNLKKERKIFIV